jgi:integrase
VWSNRERKRIRKTFPSMAAAKGWRQDAGVAVRAGALRAPKPTTLQQAVEVWLAGAKEGTIRNRSGDVYSRARSVRTSTA